MKKEWVNFYKAIFDIKFQSAIVQENLEQLQAHLNAYVRKIEKIDTKQLETINRILTLTKEAFNALALIGGAINDERSDEHKVVYVKKVIEEFMALLERWMD